MRLADTLPLLFPLPVRAEDAVSPPSVRPRPRHRPRLLRSRSLSVRRTMLMNTSSRRRVCPRYHSQQQMRFLPSLSLLLQECVLPTRDTIALFSLLFSFLSALYSLSLSLSRTLFAPNAFRRQIRRRACEHRRDSHARETKRREFSLKVSSTRDLLFDERDLNLRTLSSGERET